MKKIWLKACLPIIILSLAYLVACGGQSRLKEVEQLMETNVAAADSILSSLSIPKTRRDRALLAVLKTQADYKLFRDIKSDSLIKTATDYYGTSTRCSHAQRYHSALAWYSQGCVYSEMGNDLAAIDAYLKAKDLFPDTLIRYYALTEQKLGKHHLNKMMLDPAKYDFECCKINADRLNDTKMQTYAFFNIGLCALYNSEFLIADSIFRIISEDEKYSYSQKTTAMLQLSKINLFYHKDFDNALKYINNYLSMSKNNSMGAGLSVKADIFYEMHIIDSAYYYSKQSMSYETELYTKCSNADRLTELSQLKGESSEPIYWHRLYSELRDSINKIERSLEVEELQYKHNEAITEEKYAHKHLVVLIVGSSVVILTMLILLFVYYSFKHKAYKRIVEKQQELKNEEAVIHKKTIEMLESKIRALSVQDPEARKVLIESYSSRLTMCTNEFRTTTEYNMLASFRLGVKRLDKYEKTIIFNQLKHSYLETITDFQRENFSVKENDILTILLKYLGLNLEQNSEIFSITVDSIKKRLYRLSQKTPSDFLKIFEG